MKQSVPYSTAILASILSTVLSSLAWITEREAVLALSPLMVSSFCLLLGGVTLLVIAHFRFPWPGRETLKEHLSSFLFLVCSRNVIGQLLFVYALTLTSASKVMVLTKIEPYLIIFWLWLWKQEKVKPYALFLLGVHVFGAIILSTGGHFELSFDQLGDLLVLGGVAVNVLTYGPAQKLSHDFGSTWLSGLTACAGGILILPFALFMESDIFVFSPERVRGWYYLLVTVALFYTLSTVFWFYALRGMKAWLASALRCIGPVIAAPIAWIYFDQELSALQLVGAAVVLTTSVLMVREKQG